MTLTRLVYPALGLADRSYLADPKQGHRLTSRKAVKGHSREAARKPKQGQRGAVGTGKY